MGLLSNVGYEDREVRGLYRGTGKTEVERVEGGVQELLRWSANVCDPNARTDLVSTRESSISSITYVWAPHLGSLWMIQ